ncbi:MAG TPA: universal stress protein [Candidatus Krumholzibacteria bacterium]|nr:universal stress protein [Candidatus Krumholzibacteria bacterium]
MLNFNVIVMSTDLSDYSLRALPYAIGLAERFDAVLKILCINEPSVPIADVAWTGIDVHGTDNALLVEAQQTLDKIVREQVPKHVRAEATVITGNAVDGIIQFARDQNADLLVMCTHGRTGLSHVLMGSTAEAVVRRAPCPVLTLRQPMPVAGARRGS